LVQYINWLASGGAVFDVLLRSSSIRAADYDVAGLKIAPVLRTVPDLDESRIEFNKRRVGSKGDERAGLKDTEIRDAEAAYAEENVPDRIYRQVPGRNPLFLIYFAKITKRDSSVSKIVPAYGISFPGDAGSLRRPEKLVEYVVNTTWWQQNFDLTDEDSEEEE
jgi:hypothetical protein